MVATLNPNLSLGGKIHQVWKKAWLAGMGIYPTLRVSLASPNPGEQAWTIFPPALSERPVVVSLGLAENLSFDLSMIRNYRAVVHGYDPTPTTQAWVAKNPLPADFHYHCLAVAGHDGWLDLFERCGKGGKGKGAVFQKAPCRRLSGVCRGLGLVSIDVLKMDIEGSEYPALHDLLKEGPFPTQIAVEFHHRFEEMGVQKTRQAHQALARHGYRLAHISPWAEEFLYLRQGSSSP
jgi:FkbM family methyltransferase